MFDDKEEMCILMGGGFISLDAEDEFVVVHRKRGSLVP